MMCCDECHRLLTSMHESLTNLTLLQRDLMQRQITDLPKYLTQARQYLKNATQLNFQYHMQSQTLMRVTTLIVTCTSAATLQIAERTFSFTGSTTQNYDQAGGLVIRPEDYIFLSQASAGDLGLEFLGQEIPDRGKRW